MLSLFNPKPCAKRALKLREDFNTSFIQSLEHLLEASSEILDPPLFHLLQVKISSLKPETLFNGFLYNYNAELIQAIEENDISKVKDLFLKLCEEDSQTNNFFSNFSNISKHHQGMFKKIAAYEYPTPPIFAFLSDEAFNTATSGIRKALKIIETNLSDLFEEINTVLSEVLLFKASAPKAGSSFDLFGIIYANLDIKRDNIVDIIDFIVHETAHSYLYLICCQDPLTLNPLTERYKAPFRDDERPISGIYHATFVLMRLVYALDILIKLKILTLNEETYAKRLINSYKERFFLSVSILRNNAQLTTLGKNLLESCEAFVQSTNNSN